MDCSCLRVLCYVYFLLKLSHTYFQMQMPNEAPDPALGDGGYQGTLRNVPCRNRLVGAVAQISFLVTEGKKLFMSRKNGYIL